jgi:hypothetical protein
MELRQLIPVTIVLTCTDELLGLGTAVSAMEEAITFPSSFPTAIFHWYFPGNSL